MWNGKSNNVALKARSDVFGAGDHDAARRGNGSDGRPGRHRNHVVERCFNDELSRLYIEMLDEPLPDRLQDLLEQLRRGKKSMAEKPY
jgi:Anti-sigma factor NepR